MTSIVELSAPDLAAMLCSRVCHDLINPVGAIGNGLEVLADPTQVDMQTFAKELIENSTRQARAKLEFARLAFGASSTAGTDIDTREADRVATLLMAGEKADLDWKVAPMLLPKNKAKLLLNMLLIVVAGVPRGGTVTVEVEGEAGAESFTITATGPKTLIPNAVQGLLAGTPEDGSVDARGIQPFYTGVLARLTHMGLNLALDGEILRFTADPLSHTID
ncbi:histidine phosphotransferase family protein [Pelagibacterium flavum]|uniref:Histidine phosphotransferase family protein n=1 Tax=Pelagibacterium flavum TaxID=2984530 RepID=A0ABY6IUU2_9HYPH|nr:histidine phosphotransferase family protein [Pelagibacterium sp. YIM 151497]UYQ73072.1 histidine phosphotransferase family protein [Pelagibacterium sp. YIM 151497]|tara:strand:- start:1725 stop:2384 length:660 start_codon:yes stop_codon:yes gene_type:complete|eukprot:jgi/Tetstr1/451523/TSEL_038559.t1